MDTADPLRTFLADRNVPCPKCQYNLRALQQPLCPECGAPLELGVLVAGRAAAVNSWLRTATHPALLLLGAMVAGFGIDRVRGVAVVLALWIAVMVGIRLL